VAEPLRTGDPEVRAALEAEVRRRIAPSPETLDRLSRAREGLLALAGAKALEIGSPLVRPVIAGSAARGTFLSDRVDIDLFLLFPPELERAALEHEGMRLAASLFTNPERRYAEHPYLRGSYDGFPVDAVPGYAIQDPSHPLTAVDRTPFHHEWLQRRQTFEMVEEVRLAKQFLRAQGIYGSEARTQGFSGYAVELLILRFGSLDRWLEAVRGWRPPVKVVFTPGAEPRVPEETPLRLDDPVDPNRNVTSALSRRSFATLLLAAEEYLADPRPVFFEAAPAPRLSPEEARRRLALRGTVVAGLRLPRPAFVDDIVCPQLARAERVIGEEAARLGFRVIGTSSAAGEAEVVLLLEAEPAELPTVRVHAGPPPGVGRRDGFLLRWGGAQGEVLQGPYVDAEGKLSVDVRRTERRLEELLTSALPRLSLGKDLVASRPPEARFQLLPELSPSPTLDLALGSLLDRALPWRRARAPPG
jgi:tRNA nucleotidyltransferase (CCA-adding enzyme)